MVVGKIEGVELLFFQIGIENEGLALKFCGFGNLDVGLDSLQVVMDVVHLDILLGRL